MCPDINYIEYNGKTSLNIIPSDLIICNFGDYSETNDFATRELIKTEQTVSRPKPNHLGTKYSSVIEFTIGFIKEDGTQFTQEEVETITQWLYSPTIPEKLKYYGDNWDNEKYYKGIFSGITSQRIGHIWGLAARFTNDSPFYYADKEIIGTGTGQVSVVCPVNASNADDYTYPAITIETDKTETATIQWFNNGNEYNTTLNLYNGLPLLIDCENYIVSDTAGIKTFKDVGWTNVANVKWPNFQNGDNVVTVKSETDTTIVKVTITYTDKIIGGIPDEFNV